MNKLVIVMIISLLLVGCGSKEEVAELNMELREVNQENVLLVGQLENLESQIEIFEEKLKLVNDVASINSNEETDSINLWTKNLSNVAVGYRKDIFDIFEQLAEIDNSNGFRYFGSVDFSGNEEERIQIEISKFLNDKFDGGRAAYDKFDYIGEEPEPYNLVGIIGIVDSSSDETGVHKGEVEEKTKYQKVYYYKSELMCSGNGIVPVEEPYYIYRGPFATTSFLYITIEEKDGEWVVTYIGND